MSESFDLSAECDHLEFIQKGTKICGKCGTNIQALTRQAQVSDAVAPEVLTAEVQAIDPVRAKEFKDFVQQVLSDGNQIAEVLDALLDGAQDMGISQAQAVTLIEQTRQEQEQNTLLELKLSYDASSARAGVANGNTVLSFRIENASKKNIQKLSISILHPQTKNKIHLKPVTGLLRGMQKTVETDLVLSLVGFHSVRDGIVSAQSLTGAIEDYAIASEIRIYAENSEAARANISSQSFTTNMGGVISADGANSAPPKKDQQARAWEPIRLVRLNAQQQELEPSVLAPVSPPTPVAVGEVHEITHPVKVDKPEVDEEDDFDPDAYLLDRYGPADAISRSSDDHKLINPFKNLDLGPPLRVLQAEDFSSIEKAKTTFEEILNDFVRLLQILAQADPEEVDVVWLRSQIDYFQLRQISNSLEIDPDDIVAVYSSQAAANGLTESVLNGSVIVIGFKGFYYLDSVSSPSRSSWSPWKGQQEHGYSIAGSFDDQIYCVKLSSAAKVSFITWHVSDRLANEIRDELVSRLAKRFEQLLSTDEIIRKLDAQQLYQSYGVVTDTAAESNAVSIGKENESNIVATGSASESNAVVIGTAIKNDGSVAANEQNRLTINDELLSDPHEAAPEPLVSQRDHSYLETCLMSFFSEYAQLSELYEPPLAKTIYIFNRNDAHTATVDSSLVDQLVHVLGHVEPVVVAVDALDQQLNVHAQLSGWTGLASVITQEGIYHVTSNDGNEYEWDRDAAFLSWRAFRVLSAGLQQRLMMPDIWLGSTTEVLIKGSYLNFEKNIIGWIDFHNIHQTKLLERFKQLSTAISTESL
jgi:hypothetical protein